MEKFIDLNKNFSKYLYWSNACGNLHYHGKHDISTEELPEPLQRAYTELFAEGQFSMNCYLAEYDGEYGISLEAEYDTAYAKDLHMDYADLLHKAKGHAEILADKYPEYKVLFGIDTEEWSNGDRASQLVVFLPWNIAKTDYDAVGETASAIVYDF